MTPNMISACETAVITMIANQLPLIPVYMSGQAIPATASIYAKFFVIPSDDSTPVGLGITARTRNVGILQVTVVGPKDMGAGPTSDIANVFRAWLTRRTIEVPSEGFVILKDATMRDLGNVKEEHKYTVRCGYRFDLQI